MKAYRQTSGDIVIFRPEAHAARIAKSAAAVCLPPPPKDLFVECVRAAVAANAELVPPSSSNGALYIRPVLFGSSAQLALAPSEESILAVYVYPLLPYHGSAATDALVLEDFDRTAPFGTGPFKVGGNYAPVWKHAAAAKEKGYGITLHVDSATRTKIDEFSTSGFLGFKSDGSEKTLVVPLAENAVQSVTSASLTRIAELQGWTIQRDEVSHLLRATAQTEKRSLDEYTEISFHLRSHCIRFLPSKRWWRWVRWQLLFPFEASLACPRARSSRSPVLRTRRRSKASCWGWLVHYQT